MELHYYVDGGVLGRNPSPEGVYFSVAQDWPELQQTQVLIRKQISRDYHSNNDAEYLAVQAVLAHVLTKAELLQLDNVDWVNIYSDSLLVVKQVSGAWQCKEASLFPLMVKTRELIAVCQQRGLNIALQHVDRKENVKRLGH